MIRSQTPHRRPRPTPRSPARRPRALALELLETRLTPGFLGASNYVVSAGPRAVAVADLIGDGQADLVTANANSNTVSVLLSDGHGGFRPRVDYAVGFSPQAVAVADLNNDGIPD